MISDNLSI
jgi:hypothetical protein